MSEPTQPVLVYDRIDANRRRTALLLFLFGTIPLPLFLTMLGSLAELLLVVLVVTLASIEQATGISLDRLAATLETFTTQPRALVGLAAVLLTISLSILLLVIWLHYRGAARFVLRAVRARGVTKEEEPRLWRTVENLCIGAGLPQPAVYVVESPAANAFATGLDPRSASVVVTRGLLELLEGRELEGVIAHELSHIGNHDIRLSSVVTAVFRTILLPASLPFRFFRLFFRARWVWVRVLGVVMMCWLLLPLLGGLLLGLLMCVGELLGGLDLSVPTKVHIYMRLWCGLALYCWLAVPTLAFLIRRAVFRQREFLADADAVLLTRNPGALARALAKIAAADSTPIEAHPATAHLYIVNPLRRGNDWWNRILGAHPPIEDRITRLKDMGAMEVSPLPAPADAEPVLGPLPEMPDSVSAEPRWLSLGQILLILSVFLAAFVLGFWFLIRTGK